MRLSASSSNLVRGTIADYVDRRRYKSESGECLESGDSAGILLVSGSNGNSIISNSLTHSGDGFFIGNSCQRASHNNYVYGNDGSYSPHNAFECTFSGGNVFERNTANASDYGFWLGYSGNTRVTGNEISGNRFAGIAVEHGVGNEFDRNTISRNSHGVRLWADNNNCLFPDCGTTCPSARYRIHHNNLTLNTDGVRIETSSDRLVWRNHLTNNTNQNVYTSGASSPVRVEQNNLTCQGTTASGEPVRNAAQCRYAAYNEVAAGRDVVALRNWWGTTSASSVTPLIFDQEDDPSKSRVLYNPFLHEPIPATSGASGPGVGQWMTTEPLKQASAAPFADRGQQLVFYNNRVYVFGGQGPGSIPQTGVYYAALRPDGTET